MFTSPEKKSPHKPFFLLKTLLDHSELLFRLAVFFLVGGDQNLYIYIYIYINTLISPCVLINSINISISITVQNLAYDLEA